MSLCIVAPAAMAAVDTVEGWRLMREDGRRFIYLLLQVGGKMGWCGLVRVRQFSHRYFWKTWFRVQYSVNENVTILQTAAGNKRVSGWQRFWSWSYQYLISIPYEEPRVSMSKFLNSVADAGARAASLWWYNCLEQVAKCSTYTGPTHAAGCCSDKWTQIFSWLVCAVWPLVYVAELETKTMQRFAKISQSRRRSLLGPYPGWEHLQTLSFHI